MSYFNEYFYLSNYPDVQQAVNDGLFASGWQHFNKNGARENRDPNINFDSSYYLSENSDVQAAVNSGIFNSGLQHFESHGARENRAPTSFLTNFNSERYLTENSDVQAAVTANAFDSGLDHYLQFGAAEGRVAYSGLSLDLIALPSTGVITPVPFFSESFYLATNSDVRSAVSQDIFKSGLEHYLLLGAKEGRDPSSVFDSSYYLESNTDVRAAVDNGTFSSALDHFNSFGNSENRPPNLTLADFNAARYLNENPDVESAVISGGFASALDHYLKFGAEESRPAYSTAGGSIQGATDTFVFSVGSTSVDEGSSVTFNVQTQGIPESTAFDYTITGVSAADLTSGSLTGTVVIDAQGRAFIPLTLVADAITEGAETMMVSIAGYTASVTVNDTSTTGTVTPPEVVTSPGQSFALTLADDNFVGGAGNDTFAGNFVNGGGAAFDSVDILDGGAGSADILNITTAGVAILPPDTLWSNVSNIEKVTFTTSGSGAQTITTGANFNAAFASGVNLTSQTDLGAITINMSGGPSYAHATTIATTTIGAGAHTITTGAGAATVTAVSTVAGSQTILGAGLTEVTATIGGAGNQIIGGTGTDGQNLVSVTATINGAGNQTITSTSTSAVAITATAAAGAQTIVTGSGADRVTSSATAGQATTITTGAGSDIIITGASTDLITGGSGSDTMTGGGAVDTFAMGVNGSIIGTSRDIIADFNTLAANDILTFGASTTVLAIDATATIAGTNVQTSAGGLITFAAGDNSLALKIAAVQADAELDVANSVAMFVDSGNTYVYYAGTAAGNVDDQLIQLSGIATLTTITGGATTTIA